MATPRAGRSTIRLRLSQQNRFHLTLKGSRLLAAKILCCGALVLAAAGAISLVDAASWLLEGGFDCWKVASIDSLPCEQKTPTIANLSRMFASGYT
ncbi:hypothetical protein M728_001230 [Ensifer sp. WSM1721]|uniref:hypothetical protein n=1 Tax=Ensifer sp. WSM1721 TaxID=1041159 RepID=UPI0004796A07|nr:hypothetical protein [Ensifer sp. WSM1721]